MHDEILKIYMQLLEAFVGADHKQSDTCPALRKDALMAISSVARLVEALIITSMSESNQAQLALLLTRLCHLAQPEVPQISILDRRRQPSEVSGVEMLRHSARRVCEKKDILFGLQKDLQVCAVRRQKTTRYIVNGY